MAAAAGTSHVTTSRVDMHNMGADLVMVLLLLLGLLMFGQYGCHITGCG